MFEVTEVSQWVGLCIFDFWEGGAWFCDICFFGVPVLADSLYWGRFYHSSTLVLPSRLGFWVYSLFSTFLIFADVLLFFISMYGVLFERFATRQGEAGLGRGVGGGPPPGVWHILSFFGSLFGR